MKKILLILALIAATADAQTSMTPCWLSGSATTCIKPVNVASGGTGLASGTSGGVLAYTASGTLASSGALTSNAVVIGGGAGVVPTVVTNNSTGTNEFLTQSSSGTPAWAALVAGDLPVATSGANGAMSTTTQTMAGAKTWNDNQVFKTGSGATQMGSYTSSGWVIGTVSNTSDETDVYGGDTSSDPGLKVIDTASASTTGVVAFKVQLVNEVTGNIFAAWATNSNGIIGSVSSSGTTAVLYNTTSDARLKTGVTDVTGAIDKMRSVRPVDFTWKADGRQDQGFLAQELQQVYPYAVSGDPDSDVTRAPMAIDYGRITPLLAAAIKDLIKENDALKARLDAADL